uniref:Uncharacterized protein n=1 Tax=Salvator merianae TaxID=96440 RepID=A0A8D0DUB7_SALMN
MHGIILITGSTIQRAFLLALTDCPPDKIITDEMAKDDLMPIYYEPSELQACLNETNLIKYFSFFSQYAFTEQQLQVMKQKMDEIFPQGFPEPMLRNLGGFINEMTPEDVKKWNITSVETLTALLNMPPPDALVSAIWKSCATLDRGMEGIGKIAYLFSSFLFRTVDPPLDPSHCPQTTKDILYPKAKRAFSDRHNEFPFYFLKIEPYLGGAPQQDLTALSKNNVNMDINTFLGLRNDAVMVIEDVKNLLGKNLKDLKNFQGVEPIKGWIYKQKQSALDELGLGLQGGLPEGYIVLPQEPARRKRAALAFN